MGWGAVQGLAGEAGEGEQTFVSAHAAGAASPQNSSAEHQLPSKAATKPAHPRICVMRTTSVCRPITCRQQQQPGVRAQHTAGGTPHVRHTQHGDGEQAARRELALHAQSCSASPGRCAAPAPRHTGRGRTRPERRSPRACAQRPPAAEGRDVQGEQPRYLAPATNNQCTVSCCSRLHSCANPPAPPGSPPPCAAAPLPPPRP